MSAYSETSRMYARVDIIYLSIGQKLVDSQKNFSKLKFDERTWLYWCGEQSITWWIILCSDGKSWHWRIRRRVWTLINFHWLVFLFDLALRKNPLIWPNSTTLIFMKYTMTVLLNFAVSWDSSTERVKAYFNREKSLHIYINEILQNSSPLFCSVFTYQHMVLINHVTLF